MRLLFADAAPGERVCRGCGCTDGHACVGGCSWVLLDIERPTGICSRCAHDCAWDQNLFLGRYDGDFVPDEDFA